MADEVDEICQTTEPDMMKPPAAFETAPYMIKPGSGRLPAPQTRNAARRTKNSETRIFKNPKKNLPPLL